MTTMKISGMSCQHCVNTVRTELEEAGAQNVQVDLKAGQATWEAGPNLEKAAMIIKDFGFIGKEA